MAAEPGYEAASISVERKTGHDLILDTSSIVPAASYSVAPGPVSEDTSINIGSRIYGWYNANPSNGLPNTVYTTSTTPVTGMTLYNSLGHDLGLTISVVNQDGSFDIIQN